MAGVITRESLPAEYQRSDWLKSVVGAELADLERHPVSYRPGEQEQMIQDLKEAGMQLPLSPLIGTSRIPAILRDPRIFIVTSALLFIANK